LLLSKYCYDGQVREDELSMYGAEEESCRVLVQKSEGREYLEDLGVGERIILKFILKREKVWIAIIWLRIGTVVWLF
jgi:hypothetical protein